MSETDWVETLSPLIGSFILIFTISCMYYCIYKWAECNAEEERKRKIIVRQRYNNQMI